MLRDAKYGMWRGDGGLIPSMVWEGCVPNPWGGLGGVLLPPWEEVSPPLLCKAEIVDGWPWELDPSKVEPRKDDPNIVVLTGVWDGWVGELVRLGTPPRIGGRFYKHLERRGFCGSPMMSDWQSECVKMVMREINEQETCIIWTFTIYLTIACNQMSVIHKSTEKKHTCG